MKDITVGELIDILSQFRMTDTVLVQTRLAKIPYTIQEIVRPSNSSSLENAPSRNEVIIKVSNHEQ